MNKFNCTALAFAALFAVTACTNAPVTTLAPGKYESRTKTVTTSGTRVERKSATEVDVDQYGNKSATTTTKTTTDPKGFFNKTTTERTTYVHD